jgi:DNA-binding protein H-NS
MTVRYRNPTTGDTHSGLSSKQPPWLVEAAKKGRKEDFRIPDEDLPKYNPHLQHAK